MKKGGNSEIFWLFIKKETILIAGKRFFTFWFLALVFYITFLAIGFANGSRNYLEEKMSDFFIRWVPISLGFGQDKQARTTIRELSGNNKAKKQYFYEKVLGNNFQYLHIWDNNRRLEYNGTYSKPGQSIDINSDLLSRISQKLIHGETFQQPDDPGLIVTDKLLEELHYPEKTPYILMSVTDSKGKPRQIPLPIKGVVEKELPGLSEIMYTQYFYENRIIPGDKNPFNVSNIRGIYLLTEEKNEDRLKQITEIIEEGVQDDPWLKGFQFSVDTTSYNYAYIPCTKIIISFDPDSSLATRDTIFSIISRFPGLKKYSWVRFYDFHRDMHSDLDTTSAYEMIYVQFTRLDSIAAFKTFLLNEHGLHIDMSDVEARKNYNFVSSLTKIISWGLIMFSALCICLFVFTVLRMHLDKIRMNIGTFSAFGLSPRLLENVYLFIMLIFITFSMAVGCGFAALTGYLGGMRLIMDLLKSNFETDWIYFDLKQVSTLIAILFFFTFSYITLKISSFSIFHQTPGNLIYNRDE
jgi:hypothetical protein